MLDTIEIIDPKQIEEFVSQLKLFAQLKNSCPQLIQRRKRDEHRSQPVTEEREITPEGKFILSYFTFDLIFCPVIIRVSFHPNGSFIEFFEDPTDEPEIWLDLTPLTRCLVEYLQHKQQNPDFTGEFADYIDEHLSESVYLALYPGLKPYLRRVHPEEQDKKKQEEIELDKLVDSINSSMAELVSRAESLRQDKRKQLLAKINIPDQLLKREYVLEFDDTSTKAREHPTVTVIQSSDNQAKNEPIDIFKKIREDINNLRNPIIFAAIQRWIQVIRYKNTISKDDVNIAKRHIEKLQETINAYIKENIIEEDLALGLSVDKVEIAYLRDIWEILRSEEVRRKSRQDEKLRQFYRKLGISEDGKQIDFNVLLTVHQNTKIIHTRSSDKINSRVDIESLQPSSEQIIGYSSVANIGYTGKRLARCIKFLECLAKASNKSESPFWTRRSFDKLSWAHFRNLFLLWRLTNHLDPGRQLSATSMKKYILRAKSAFKRQSDKLQKVLDDPLYKTGHFDGVDRSLKNKTATIVFNPTTNQLEFTASPIRSYTPQKKES